MITVPRYNMAYAITPSDGTNEKARGKGTSGQALAFDAIYVGATGDVTVVLQDDSTVLFKAVPVGVTIPIQGKRVNSTGTTATQLIALQQL